MQYDATHRNRARVHPQVRAGEGFMFWGLTLSLTEKGLGHIPEVLLAAHRALGLVLGLSQEDRRRVHEEVAEVGRYGCGQGMGRCPRPTLRCPGTMSTWACINCAQDALMLCSLGVAPTPMALT